MLGLIPPPGLGGIANPLMDPLFMRPREVVIDINDPAVHNNIFGVPPPAFGMEPPRIAGGPAAA